MVGDGGAYPMELLWASAKCQMTSIKRGVCFYVVHAVGHSSDEVLDARPWYQRATTVEWI